MKFSLSGIFRKRSKTDSRNTAEQNAQSVSMKTAGALKKRTPGSRKKMLPFFRKIQIWTSVIFTAVFAVSLLGFISFSTIDASLSKGSDASLPLNVRNVKNEYMSIKENYSKFDFNTFRKLLGQGARQSDSSSWEGLSGAFFGTDHLKYIKAASDKTGDVHLTPEEAGLQTPQINIMGMSMKNDREMVIALSYNGRQETWLMEKKGSKWVSNSLPSEYVLGSVDPYGISEIPYFEIALRSTPEIKWRVQMAKTAVKSEGRLGSDSSPGVISETDKMRTAGSYIMIKENGKTRYINMAQGAPETGGQKADGVSYNNRKINTRNDLGTVPPEVQKMIESIPVNMPVTGPGGEKGTLNTTVNIEKPVGAESVPQQESISSIEMVREPASDMPEQPLVSE